ncbi:ATP-binding protein [Massilia sp. MAHUQ-52]|uniref:ATP-binding protein n=1 Tax=Massilia agrisoli TaxID=2892444 RepID=A0ABS8ITR9_9BURK|nr:ATP-binding protein [Massilia agrisoli]
METVLTQSAVHSTFHVGELSEIAAARRAAAEMARRLSFDETRAGRLALVVTEAATNIVKHAREGEILLRPIVTHGHCGIEVLAIDSGPGMASVDLLMADGTSTAGTYGVGLGAIRRQADSFDIYSAPGRGTVVMMTVWCADGPVPETGWEVGAVCLPIPGEDECGDNWGVSFRRGGISVVVADGLGHGPEAALASTAAVGVSLDFDRGPPGVRIEDAHGALRSTRGAALAIADIDAYDGKLLFAGVGNIAASIISNGPRRHLLSHNGIVGSNLRKVQEFEQPWDSSSLLILHSDGINTRWDLGAYPGLSFNHASVIAAVIYRDFLRGRDDASVVVIREHPVS